MRHRWAVVAPLVVVTCLVLATPGSAFCIVQPIEQVVRSSDIVWLATVTDAHAASRGDPGIWDLTVRIDDVLKGEGSQGESAAVFASTCGPFILPRFAREQARGFVGEQRLVFGSLNRKGEIVGYGGIVEPQRLSLDERYEMALDILGLIRPDDVRVASPATDRAQGNAREHDEEDVPWLAWVAVAVIVVAGVFIARRRRARPSG